MTLSGTITVGSLTPVNYFTGTVSATIKGSNGNLWGFGARNPSNVEAGLRLLNYQGGLPSAIATVVAEMLIPSKDYRSRDFTRPVSFGTLVGSTVGTLLYNVLYE